jgi:serine/threonine protein kinase
MLQVKLADFNVAKLDRSETVQSTTRSQSVPGTLYFQSPEQEINVFELLVNVEAGSPEVEFFEDFYTEIHENDVFALFNRNESYNVASADRGRKRLILDSPYQGPSETNVRAQVTKSVGRPADIYSLGGFFYYLFSGASANPKSLHDAFRKFIEWDKKDESNTVEAYIDYEYKIIQNLRAPKDENGDVSLAPDDRFFSYKHYLDGNGTLIDQGIMTIIAKAMIRNKPDSYCQSWDLRTCGVSQLVDDLYALYLRHGVDPSARAMYAQGHTATQERRGMRRALDRVADRFRRR